MRIASQEEDEMAKFSVSAVFRPIQSWFSSCKCMQVWDSTRETTRQSMREGRKGKEEKEQEQEGEGEDEEQEIREGVKAEEGRR